MEKENPEYLIPNCTAIAAICSSYCGKDVIDEGEIFSLKPSLLLQCIEALGLDGQL